NLMGFYIRKGIRFGPLRFNISKSGVGLSFGAKGARIGTGPRGAYTHVGRNGVYYRQKINGTVNHPKPTDSAATKDSFDSSSNPNENSVLDENAELSSKTAVDEINARIAQKTYAPAIFQFTSVTSALFVMSGFLYAIIRMQIYETLNVLGFLLFFVLAGIIFFAGYWISEAIEKHEISERTTLIQFELDEETAREYKALSNAFRELSRTDKLWQILSDTPTWDSKRNAGATSLVKRVPIRVSTGSLPFIE